MFPQYGGDGRYEFARDFVREIRNFASTHTLQETHAFAISEFNTVFDAITDLHLPQNIQNTFFVCAYASAHLTPRRKITHVDRLQSRAATIETLPDTPGIAYASICPMRDLTQAQHEFAATAPRDPVAACTRMLERVIDRNPGTFSGLQLVA